MIGVVGYGPFVGRSADGRVDNSTEGLFRHLNHFVELVGPEHVGLGLDYVFDIQEALDFYQAFPERLPASAGYSAQAWNWRLRASPRAGDSRSAGGGRRVRPDHVFAVAAL